MTQSLELAPTIQISPDLVSRIGHKQYLRLTMIVERLPRILGARSTLGACREVAGEIPDVKTRSLYKRIQRYKSTLTRSI